MKHLILVLVVALVTGCGKHPLAQHVQQTQPKSAGVISFHSDRAGSDQIFAVNADGTDLRALTDQSVSATFPKWSANGDRLAYAIDRGDGIRISYVDLGNPNTPMLWVAFALKDTAFSWSPDGL